MKEKGIIFTPELEKTTHDYRINNLYTLDVKTKDRTVTPEINFDNSALLYNHRHQSPDYYLFL